LTASKVDPSNKVFLGSVAKDCMYENLIELVNGIDGPVIVAGDFNDYDNDPKYVAFLSATGIKDENSRARRDYIAYRGVTLSYVGMPYGPFSIESPPTTPEGKRYSDHPLIYADVVVPAAIPQQD
jgi:hypothetical protein